MTHEEIALAAAKAAASVSDLKIKDGDKVYPAMRENKFPNPAKSYLLWCEAADKFPKPWADQADDLKQYFTIYRAVAKELQNMIGDDEAQDAENADLNSGSDA